MLTIIMTMTMTIAPWELCLAPLQHYKWYVKHHLTPWERLLNTFYTHSSPLGTPSITLGTPCDLLGTSCNTLGILWNIF